MSCNFEIRKRQASSNNMEQADLWQNEIKRLSSPCAGLERTWGFQDVEFPTIYRQSAQEGGKVVSPMHRPPLPPRIYSRFSFLSEIESTPGDIVQPEGSSQWKIPVTSSGIEPATFMFLAPCLNQLRHRVPTSQLHPMLAWRKKRGRYGRQT